MYIEVDENIFESPAQTLVNTVNTVGAMGKGLAKEFKRLFPEMFKEYQKRCENRKTNIGSLWLYRTPNKWVLNFPTKKHWRQPSNISYVEEGLKSFVKSYSRARINSIAFPKLGCGNGELDWNDVSPLMKRYLYKLPIDIYVHITEKPLIPEHKDIKEMRKWLMNEPSAYSFNSLKTDLIDLLQDKNRFAISNNEEFFASKINEGIEIDFENNKSILQWEGDNTGFGLLELWQFVRDKKMCRITDIKELGIDNPDSVLALLSKLPIFKPLKIISNGGIQAIQLEHTIDDLTLFDNCSDESEIKSL
ncbi:MAG: macro domain-containing protein [candidate division Zixibacteria bacterium]|nr:macro domain-containing protein [candidate division Zixibacteria bacterium]